MKTEYGFKKLLNALLISLQSSRVTISHSLIKTFGIFGIINFTVFYVLWNYIFQQEYDGLPMRFIAFCFCFFLALIDCWPEVLKSYIPSYWYLSIFYCLPFFGMYMFLENYASNTWLTNVLLGIFWLVLVTDWITFIIILPAGIVMGWLAHYLIKGPIFIDLNAISGPLMNYAWAIVIAAVFSHRKELIRYEEKINSITMLAGTIAHEMRTPLSTMAMIGVSLKSSLTDLFERVKNKQPIEPDPFLLNAPEQIQSTARSAFTIIDMILMNLKGASEAKVNSVLSIQACVTEAIKSYPLTRQESKLIHCDLDVGFQFKGNETLFKHILFNLLKNALYYVKAADKGGIFITTQQTANANILIFKDTGAGMPAAMVPYVFDRFYSKTQHGTGIGLAFCKSVMESFGGKITCMAEEGEHTTFILSFPKV